MKGSRKGHLNMSHIFSRESNMAFSAEANTLSSHTDKMIKLFLPGADSQSLCKPIHIKINILKYTSRIQICSPKL